MRTGGPPRPHGWSRRVRNRRVRNRRVRPSPAPTILPTPSTCSPPSRCRPGSSGGAHSISSMRSTTRPLSRARRPVPERWSSSMPSLDQWGEPPRSPPRRTPSVASQTTRGRPTSPSRSSHRSWSPTRSSPGRRARSRSVNMDGMGHRGLPGLPGSRVRRRPRARPGLRVGGGPAGSAGRPSPPAWACSSSSEGASSPAA